MRIARRSRGTPRLANRLLKRCRDYAEVCHDGHIDHDVAKAALDKLQVDSMGLDVNDRNILMTMIEKFAGRCCRSGYTGGLPLVRIRAR